MVAPVQCSTPFGITADNTGRPAISSASYNCAQRLSASLRTTRKARMGPTDVVRVLNAFRHHCGQHERSRDDARPLVVVLNAFRHHCGQHRLLAAALPGPSLVLNAFRHHCGQHVLVVVFRAVVVVCSTPFGITADNTAGPPRPPCPSLPSAQRLSASLRTTRDRLPEHGRQQPGCSTPFGITADNTGLRRSGRTAGSAVLNAFRHHCGQHVERLRTVRTHLACSTPFGITADNTGGPGIDGPPDRECSTPFGITADNTPAGGRPPARTRCAQRLSASLRTTRLGRLTRPFPGRRCSTPFGITADNTALYRGSYPVPGSAQRLSASLRTTLPGRASIAVTC